jgi:Peptidase family M28
VLLEAARALASGDRRRNDVIVLFDDGEELGDYRGGELFAAHHPWRHLVRIVIGLDTAAWGVPFLMQDSPDNGVLIDGYAAGAVHPVALGLDASTNREDPAEIGAFRSRGVPGIELEDTYADVVQHTAGDTLGHIELDSLQMMGDQTLGAAREYSGLDLRRNTGPDQTFFTLPGLGVLHYPARWGWVTATVAVLGLFAAVLLAWSRRLIRLPALAAAVAATIGLVVGAMVLAKASALAYGAVWPDPRVIGHPLDEYLLPSSGPYALAVAALLGGFLWWGYRRFRRRLGAIELGLGFLICWVALAAVGAAAVPVGGYLFQWPAAAAALSWAWVVWSVGRGSAVLAVPALIAVVLLTPQLLLAFFGGGVAVMPELAIAALLVGLAIPALAGLGPDTLPSTPTSPSTANRA